MITRRVDFSSVTLNAQGEIIARTSHSAQQHTLTLATAVTLNLVLIPAGSFLMGSFGSQGYDDERPQHHVTIASFLMSQSPITQAQWQTIMGKHATRFSGPQLPMDTVSWKEAVDFCKCLSKQTKLNFQLPSEAQWEYACRVGTGTAFNVGETITTEVANYNGEFVFHSEPKGLYRHVTTPVQTFAPNAFGLYDLHGNVWEWCADVWHESYDGAPTDGQAWTHKGEQSFRVARGGCWHDTPDVCRSAARLKYAANEGDEFTGFRVVCDLASPVS